jgi:hypothetical protein
VFTTEQGKPACEVCFVGLHGQKICFRCGESVRGCFVVPVEGKDVHVECMTCCLCHASLVVEGHIEKDGELLCQNHRSLRPVKNPNFRRPKKIGNWKAGELALVRVKNSQGFKWATGIVRKVMRFVLGGGGGFVCKAKEKRLPISLLTWSSRIRSLCRCL